MNADRRALKTSTCRHRRAGLLAGLLAGLTIVFGTVVPVPFEAASAQELLPGISLQQAVEIALAERPGRVVRAVTVMAGGAQVHEIRILLDEGGRVVTVRVDARTGRVR